MHYDDMVQEALRGVMARALESVAQNGFPGEHHFLIVFHTDHPGVDISQALHRRFPHEMTIVLQHQFWDLKTDAAGFEVDLSFNNVLEHLRIPYAAVTAFTDPSVKFGLQFVVDESAGGPQDRKAETASLTQGPQDEKPADDEPRDDAAKNDADTEDVTGDIISLDAFRKK